MTKIRNAGVAFIMLLLLLLCPLTAEGSEMTEQLLVKTDVLTDEQLKEAEETVERLPDSILDCFKENEGKISFRKEPILLDERKVLGVYWLDDHMIEIWADPEIYEDGSNSLKKVMLHELGHFVYDISSERLSDKTKESLQNVYQYYSKYTKECSDISETFASMYAWYYADMADISKEMCDVISEAESLCIEEGGGLEDGRIRKVN